jgi:hypothetical protein
MVYRLAQIQLASARQLRKLANLNSASCASIWATRGVACRPQCCSLRDGSNTRWMAIDRPEGRDAREFDWAATFGRARYQLRCCEDDRRAAFGRRDGVHEVHNSLAQRRQPDAVGQLDGLGKTAIP